jgi:hypothetical protein
MPKFIQILDGGKYIYALDEDGGVWWYYERVWHKLPDTRSE